MNDVMLTMIRTRNGLSQLPVLNAEQFRAQVRSALEVLVRTRIVLSREILPEIAEDVLFMLAAGDG